MEVNVESVVNEACAAAHRATNDFIAQHGDRDACGFAWVTVYGVKGSTKLGKALIKAGFRKSYEGGLQLWNPSGNFTQAITPKEVGAREAARVLKERLGVEAYAGSRMD